VDTVKLYNKKLEILNNEITKLLKCITRPRSSQLNPTSREMDAQG